MVLSFSSPQFGTDDSFEAIVESTSVAYVLGAVFVFSLLNRALVRLVAGENKICWARVIKLWWWKKKLVMHCMCPKRRERYLRCMRRCERRRRQKRQGGGCEDKEESSQDCCDALMKHVICPFSRAANFYKLHLPAPLPLCGKRERRGSSTSTAAASVASLGESASSLSSSSRSVKSRCCASEDGVTCPARVADVPRDPTSSNNKASTDVLSCKECKRTSSESTFSTTSSSSSSSASIPRSLVVASSTSARYETSLIDLARMQQWSAILNRGVTRREAKYRDVDGLCALHWACSGGPPVEVVQMMLDAYPSAVKKTDLEGSTPLHFATHYSASPAVVDVLLKLYPKAASKRDKYGRSPLYHAVEKSSCVRIWRMLVSADPAMILTPCLPPKSSPSKSSSSLSLSPPTRPVAVRSPLFLAWINVISNRHARTSCQGRYWEKAAYLLEAAWFHKYKLPSGSTSFRLLHAALAMDLYLPEQVVTLAIQAYPAQLEEQDSVTGLHPLALATATDHYSPGRGRALIVQLLQANPAVSRRRSGFGVARSPLVHAVASGKVWTTGVQALAEADPDALQLLDRQTSLSPALLAASATPEGEEEADDYDPNLPEPTYASRTSLFLRLHLDPFGLLSTKQQERLDASLGTNKSTSEEGRACESNAAAARPPKLDRINTVYELLRADPAAALFPRAGIQRR